MTVYLDSCVVVPIFLLDPFNGAARSFLASGAQELIISDLVVAEFASVIGIRLRTKILTVYEARTALSNLDGWIAAKATRVEIQPSDIRTAEANLRRLDMTLRTADVINISIAQRLGAELATFDKRMAENAQKLGLTLAKI